jgi:hypothetical protein
MAAATAGSTSIEAGLLSSWRAPWLETTTPSQPSAAQHRVVGVHDALDDELARPQPAERLDVAPQHRRGRLLGDEIGDLPRRGAGPRVLLPVGEHRHARAQELGEPAGMA